MREIIILALLFGGPITALAQAARKAPDLRLKGVNGQNFRLADYKGKVVLINFWATWCPPCRTEMPDLIKMQSQYRNRGLRVFGITHPPQTLKEVRKFIRQLKVNYPIVLGNRATKLKFTSSETLPMTVVIDREGRVRDVIEGILLPEEFVEKIQPLLAAPTKSSAELKPKD